MTARQISVRLSLPKTTVVTAVSRLVKRGYITREQNPQDGREQFLMLTDLGEQVNKEHNQYEKYFLEGFMNLFREEDYEALADILKGAEYAVFQNNGTRTGTIAKELHELLGQINHDAKIILIAHSQGGLYAQQYKESMKFGNNSLEFATRIEEMWQGIMREYLDLSKEAMYLQPDHSSHYIHLTEPELIVREAERMMQNKN